MLLKSSKDILKLMLCLLLTLSACSLFFLPEESVAVFGNGSEYTPKSLFGLLKSLI
jgi:hypothetical protein